MRKVASVAAILAFVGMSSAAFAGSGAPVVKSLDPGLWVTVGTASTSDLITLPATNNDGANDFSFVGSSGTTGQYSIGWDFTMNPDPFIDGMITITNFSGSAQNFAVTLSLPITPPFSPGLMGGSIDATIFDLNNDGSATLQPQGSSPNIYFGRIDGVNVLPMFAQNVSCIGVGCSLNSIESQMPPSIPVSGVNNNIGTKLVFNLSAGDKVSFNTHFEVTPVPLPASAWLLLSGLGALFGLGRRNRA